MSSERIKDFYDDGSDCMGHEFMCDAKGCTENFSAVGIFTEVWEDAKREGWRTFPVETEKGKTWYHVCPNHSVHQVRRQIRDNI